MSELIRSQLLEVGIMFFCGVSIEGLRSGLLFHQRIDKPGKGISAVQDMLFWCLAGLLAAAYLYYCCYGELSIHAAAAAGLGVLFWKKFSGLVFSKFH